MSGRCVGGVVARPRQVSDVEAPRKGALLQAEQARVGDFVEGAIAEYLHQGLVVGDDDQVVASLGEVPGLLEAPCDGQGFPLYGCVTLLCR